MNRQPTLGRLAMLLAAVWAAIPEVLAADGTATELRVLSYNIHHAEGVDGKLDLERIAGVIRAVKPDIVALQEVDQRASRSERVDQPAKLAELTGMSVVFGANIPLQGGHYGNAILSRYPIVRHRNHLLPRLDNGEQRGVLHAEIRLGDEPDQILHFLATHLDHRPDDRERQLSAEFINRLANDTRLTPAILAGDLNATPDSRVLDEFRKTWTFPAGNQLETIPVKQPVRQIDFIATRELAGWKTAEVRVLKEAIASDHRPILCVFRRNQ